MDKKTIRENADKCLARWREKERQQNFCSREWAEINERQAETGGLTFDGENSY